MSLLPVARRVAPRCNLARAFASKTPFAAPTASVYRVFDRAAKRTQKDRAASRDGGERSRTVEYVRDEVADRMMERLLDIKRRFDTIVDLGSGSGHFSKLLEPDKTRKVIMIDSSGQTLNRDPDDDFEVQLERVQGDEEDLLGILPRNSQEAIVSCLSLHWVNDLPGTLVQIRETLKPDGLFLGAMFGGDTLFELRSALQLAEVDREGGISPHVSPMTDTKDMSNLLGRAGFTLLTVDTDEVRVGYPSMWELIEDLKDMGEGNAIVGRRHFLHRDTLAAASAIYQELHGNKDGSIPATFQVIYMIGWKPSPTQPKPLERGSAQTSLKDVL
ncbi:S-adenosyl-L-methionine-dependent methyltransferase [Boletus edulis]|uniref:S-adenosyl-L-methionine-dependent methyltransferase n=1 Tax=Boletus edulis BED1 TaxID=1328754 RepID=A0AAD4C844_BOLED|nr:S-adenosyl-L-methionine-dependent methyltransferase [Boletus edulis]KAF8450688.1 S-adenosyl-L-methionine-dependent methyltransferase [Boletus edulis BED1]